MFIIIGHRGSCGYEPENTLRSFKRATDMGVQMIELDVYVCKSGELVVIHDDTLDRTTNGTGKVKELTWDELKKYDAGKGEHIPLLSQVFDLVNKQVIIDVELKDPQAAQPVANLIMDYTKNKNWSANQFLVSSFNHNALSEFHKCCPIIPIAPLFANCPKDLTEKVKQLDASYTIVNDKCITKQLIDDLHKQDIKIFAYTINDKARAHELKKLNIDGIATDYPDIMQL
ncbi:glycerophosphodiester phosphodiesterase [Candidatus Dependentiae bacterium]|nr:glycerophosphodiester phosphodiesterase [Candidatus Dependentiae bacterium]